MKTEVDEDHMIEISDDDDEEGTSEKKVTLQNDDMLKDVKREESEVNDKIEQEDTNDRMEPEKITSTRRLLSEKTKMI